VRNEITVNKTYYDKADEVNKEVDSNDQAMHIEMSDFGYTGLLNKICPHVSTLLNRCDPCNPCEASKCYSYNTVWSGLCLNNPQLGSVVANLFHDRCPST